MPLFTYFSCTGGVLVAFLFLSNAYMNPPKDVFRQGETTFSIRIKSSYPKPERIVFDTSIPVIVSQQRAQLELAPVMPVVVNAFADIREPALVRKNVPRNRIAKSMIVDVGHLSSHEVSGLSYPPNW